MPDGLSEYTLFTLRPWLSADLFFLLLSLRLFSFWLPEYERWWPEKTCAELS
jgi:hypothetical protein